MFHNDVGPSVFGTFIWILLCENNEKKLKKNIPTKVLGNLAEGTFVGFFAGNWGAGDLCLMNRNPFLSILFMTHSLRFDIWIQLFREATKNGLFLVPPPLELSGHNIFFRNSFRASKNGIFS